MIVAILAYIDPGSGALLWQAVLSAFFGALFLARRTIFGFLTRFRRAPQAEDKPPSAGDRPDAA